MGLALLGYAFLVDHLLTLTLEQQASLADTAGAADAVGAPADTVDLNQAELTGAVTQ